LNCKLKVMEVSEEGIWKADIAQKQGLLHQLDHL
jgi:hypothetical protein